MQEYKENLAPSQHNQISTIMLLEKKAKELEEENSAYKKESKKKDGDFNTMKAVLEQKNELLQKQIDDYKMRELNFKLFNENILALLNDLSSDKRLPNKELIQRLETHAKEMQDQKLRNNEILKIFEEENQKLKQELKEKETIIRDLELLKEKNVMTFETKFKEIDKENNLLRNQLKQLEEELRKSRKIGNLDNDRKIQEYQMIIENIKQQHLQEMSEMHMNNNFEKKSLENTILSLQGEINKNENDNNNLLKKEIIKLNRNINDIKKSYSEESLSLKKKLEEIKKKNEILEANIKKLKVSLQSSNTMNENTNKLLKEKVIFTKELIEQNEKLQENDKKNVQKIKDLKKQVKRLEAKPDISLNESKVVQNTSKRDLLKTPNAKSISKPHKKEESKEKSALRINPKNSNSNKYNENLQHPKFFQSKLEISPISNHHQPSIITNPNNDTFESIPNSYADYLSSKPDKNEKKEKLDQKPIKIINLYGSNVPSNSYYSIKSEDDTNNHESTKEILNTFNTKVNSKSRYESNNQQDFNLDYENLVEDSKNIAEDLKNTSEDFKSSLKNRSYSQPNFNNVHKFENIKQASVILEENEEYTKKTCLEKNNSNKEEFINEPYSNSYINNKDLYCINNKEFHKASSIDNNNPLEDDYLKKQSNHKTNENYTKTDEFYDRDQEFITFNVMRNLEFTYDYNKTLETTENYTSIKNDENYEKKFKEKISENQMLLTRNKKLESELESVILELKQVKMEWALTEERKEETEVSLKNEIKYLLNKLLQAKNNKKNNNVNNVDEHSRNLSLNISGIKDALKDSILSRTSRSRSPSIYKPPSAVKNYRTLTNPTPKMQEIFKTEEFDENEMENHKKYENNSFLMKKTMNDLNKLP